MLCSDEMAVRCQSETHMQPRDAKPRNRTAGRCRSNNERFKKRRSSSNPVYTYPEKWDMFWRTLGLSLLATIRSFTLGITFLFRYDGEDRLAAAYKKREIVSSPVVIVMSAIIFRLCIAGRDTAGRFLQALPASFGFPDVSKAMINKSDPGIATLASISIALGGLVAIAISSLFSRKKLPSAIYTGYLFAYTMLVIIAGVASNNITVWWPWSTNEKFSVTPAEYLSRFLASHGLYVDSDTIYVLMFFALVAVPLITASISLSQGSGLHRPFVKLNHVPRLLSAFGFTIVWYAVLFALPMAFWFGLGISLFPGNSGNENKYSSVKNYEDPFSPNGISCEGSLSDKAKFFTCKLLFVNVSNDNLIIDGELKSGATVSYQGKSIYMGYTNADVSGGLPSPPFVLEVGKSIVFRATFSYNASACRMIEKAMHDMNGANFDLWTHANYHTVNVQSNDSDPALVQYYQLKWSIQQRETHWATSECPP
jgi:hypothetical protein